MLMVIFGAGASYDSRDDYRPPSGNPGIEGFRPPLANDLFRERLIFDPMVASYYQCVPVIPRLRRLPTDSTLEHELELLQAEAEGDPRKHVQLNAIRYYLRGIIQKCGEAWLEQSRRVTNYVTLVDRIRTWQVKTGEKVRFVTFNYDTLLEDACLVALDMNLLTIRSYVERDDYRIYKPHGSVNWLRGVENDVRSIDVERTLIELGSDLRLSKKDWHVLPGGVDQNHIGSRVGSPAIAIPVENKSESRFECPQEHLELLKADIPAVTRLLVIGWRGTEQHFLKFWTDIYKTKNTPVQALVVSKDITEAEEVAQNLRVASIKGRFAVYKHAGFSEFISGRELEAFLEAKVG